MDIQSVPKNANVVFLWVFWQGITGLLLDLACEVDDYYQSHEMLKKSNYKSQSISRKTVVIFLCLNYVITHPPISCSFGYKWSHWENTGLVPDVSTCIAIFEKWRSCLIPGSTDRRVKGSQWNICIPLCGKVILHEHLFGQTALCLILFHSSLRPSGLPPSLILAPGLFQGLWGCSSQAKTRIAGLALQSKVISEGKEAFKFLAASEAHLASPILFLYPQKDAQWKCELVIPWEPWNIWK